MGLAGGVGATSVVIICGEFLPHVELFLLCACFFLFLYAFGGYLI